MLTFLTLKQRVIELTQHKTDDTNMLSKVGNWLNFVQKELADTYDFWTELQTTYDFTTVDGIEAYDMPSDFDKPYRVIDLTNKKEIKPITEEKYVDANISNIADATEGEPDKYRIYGVSSRIKQMKLGLIPDDAYNYRVWYKLIPTDMSANDDYPFVDADRYFILAAAGYTLKWEGDDAKSAFAQQMAAKALNTILTNQMRKLGVKYQHKINSIWQQAHRS